MRKFLIVAVLSLASAQVWAQDGVEGVLRSVEQNSVSLKAQRELVDARTLETRSTNNLGNPTVSYDQLWGKPKEIGKSGEINASQPFDFPTVYTNRAKMNKLLEQQYGHEYAVFRQQILVQAKELCIQIVALRQQKQWMDEKLANAERLAGIYNKKAEAGDANVLEQNKVNLELVAARNAAKLNDVELAALESQLSNLNGGMSVAFSDMAFGPEEEILPAEQMLARYKDADPQLLSLRSGMQAAERDIKVSQAQALPGFEVGYRREFALGEHSDGFTVGMSVPLWGSRNTVKRAKAQAQAARTQLESSQVEVQTTLRQLYDKAALLRATRGEYAGALTPIRNAELLSKALEAGQISVVDYFTELSTIYQVRESLIAIERDYRLVCARINMVDL